MPVLTGKVWKKKATLKRFVLKSYFSIKVFTLLSVLFLIIFWNKVWVSYVSYSICQNLKT